MPGQVADTWLVLADDTGFSTRIVEELRKDHARIIVARPGMATEWTGSDELAVASGSEAGWGRLMSLLRNGPGIPERILHLLGLRDRKPSFPTMREGFTTALQPGFYSLLHLA